MAQMAVELQLVIAANNVITSIDEKLPLRLAVKVGRLQKALEEWSEPFSERQKDLLAKYLADGETEMTNEHPEWAAFVTEMNALMLEDADIDVEPLTIDELDGAFELSPGQARILVDAGLLTD